MNKQEGYHTLGKLDFNFPVGLVLVLVQVVVWGQEFYFHKKKRIL